MKRPLKMARYARGPEDVPIERRLRLSEVKAAAASWSERGKFGHFRAYPEGDASRRYLADLFDADDTWDNTKDGMMGRFAKASADFFRLFI